MGFATLISAQEAVPHLDDERWVFVDCRFTLSDPDRGQAEYREWHIAGAAYAHLDRDLSGPPTPGVTGRHPLPAIDALAATLGRLGIDGSRQVVAYDASTGAMVAARLWWLLKWLGHDAVAVLDGGLSAWKTAGLPCGKGEPARVARTFRAAVRPEMVVDAGAVMALRQDASWTLLDVRSRERFQGKNETIDPVAGHIPGARSAPYAESLLADGRFRDSSELAGLFEIAARGRDAAHTVFYCGSGVTAAHGVLANAHAGRGMARLYPGSWSEWITDPRRPIATE